MAYTLKASGIATNLVMCVAVDEDGTIKEFVSPTVNSNKTLGTGVAASVTAGAWKGTTRNYWSSTDNGGFDYHGVKFTASNRPTHFTNHTNGFTVWEAYHSIAATMNNMGGLVSYSNDAEAGQAGMRRHSNTNGKLQWFMSSTDRGQGTTDIASTTKLSAGVTYDNDDATTSSRLYYGLEAGSLAADGTGDHDGFGSAQGQVYGIGGFAGQGSHPASRYCSAVFNRVLTLAEMQSLHDDWFGTLFDGTPPPAVTITTLPLSNNTGSLLASTSGISAFVHNPTTGELVVLVTGLSTDADGVLEITDDLLDADTSYRVVIRVTGTGAEGMDTYTAV
jgi:hypothetical protein